MRKWFLFLKKIENFGMVFVMVYAENKPNY